MFFHLPMEARWLDLIMYQCTNVYALYLYKLSVFANVWEKGNTWTSLLQSKNCMTHHKTASYLRFCLIKLNKKDLKIISVHYHKATKRICGRNSYDSNNECLEEVNLPIFKHFLAKKEIQFVFRLFYSRSPCLSNHKYYLTYGSLFCKYMQNLFSDNNHIINVSGNPMCALISRIDYVQRSEHRSTGYDPGWLFRC